jgi:RNA polymerase sigma-70 factor, ECF subfamily
MGEGETDPVVPLLRAWAQGDRDAFKRLAPLVYSELYRLASAYMRRERPDHPLSPTELVLEAFSASQRRRASKDRR